MHYFCSFFHKRIQTQETIHKLLILSLFGEGWEPEGTDVIKKYVRYGKTSSNTVLATLSLYIPRPLVASKGLNPALTGV